MSVTFKMAAKIFLHTLFIPIKLSTLRFGVIPPRSKAVCSLTSVLFITYLTCGQVHKIFIITIKLMINFKTLTGNSARKCVSLRDHVTHFTTFLTAFIRSYCPFKWVQFSSYYITAMLRQLRNEIIGLV